MAAPDWWASIAWDWKSSRATNLTDRLAIVWRGLLPVRLIFNHAIAVITEHSMPFGIRKTLPILAFTLLGPSVAAGQATSESPAVVHVDLMDASTDPSIKSMMIKTDQQNVKAGPVTFMVSNDSKNLVHEMIVVSVAEPKTPLPYDGKDDRVIESKIKDLGEASDLQPGEKKTLSLTLKPGNYILLCNQPAHYKVGMKANLTVTQ